MAEREPKAFFNVMLHEFGVEGVKVQELFGLDEELLAMLPYVNSLRYRIAG